MINTKKSNCRLVWEQHNDDTICCIDTKEVELSYSCYNSSNKSYEVNKLVTMDGIEISKVFLHDNNIWLFVSYLDTPYSSHLQSNKYEVRYVMYKSSKIIYDKTCPPSTTTILENIDTDKVLHLFAMFINFISYAKRNSKHYILMRYNTMNLANVIYYTIGILTTDYSKTIPSIPKKYRRLLNVIRDYVKEEWSELIITEESVEYLKYLFKLYFRYK